MKICDRYSQEYRQNKMRLPGQSLPWLTTLRDRAIASFVKLGLPTLRDESWKYTSIKLLETQHYAQQLSDISAKASNILPAKLDPFCISGKQSHSEYRLVFIDGRFNARLSNLDKSCEGLVLMSLSHALQDQPAQVEARLGKISAYEEQPFTALNTAMMSDGVYLSADRNCKIDLPVHCLFIATDRDQAVACYPRLLVQLAENTQLKLIEHYVDLSGCDKTKNSSHFTAAVTEIYLGPHANLDHYLLQDGVNSTHIGGMYVEQQRDSQFTSHSYSLGAALARHDIQIKLTEPHAECYLNGLYFADGQQHVDYHTQISHLAVGCRSRQLYKGVIQQFGRTVFNGKVVIEPQAQQSDAQQLNKNLIFGENAEVDTKPELQIYADDVKCSHGATVGQLDALALFYLQSRGISKKDAETWLTYGFVSEVLQQIKDPDLQKMIRSPVLVQLNQLVGGDVGDLHEYEWHENRLQESKACQD